MISSVVLVVKAGEEAAGVFILLTLIVKGEPGDGPGHAPIWAAAAEGFAARADVGRGVVGGLVEAEVAGGCDFDLIDANDGDVGDEAAPEWRWRSGEERSSEGEGKMRRRRIGGESSWRSF